MCPSSAPAPLPALQSLTVAQLASAWGGVGAAAAAAATLRALYLDGAASIDAMTELGAARRARLAEIVRVPRIERLAVEPAGDGSVRHAFRLADGAVIESVLLPHHAGSGRYTVCVSSQAGCALACRFCATGRLGLKRNLEAWEIVDQVAQVTALAGVRASDLVFMGMGEPLANEAAVFQAAQVMTQSHGLQIGARRITISTAGMVPAIHRFVDAARPYRLVFSLGCADPAKRLRLMPIQEHHGFESFLGAVRAYERLRRGKHVTLEYVAIRNFTMGEDDVAALADLAARAGFRFLLNVIPFNPVGDEFEAPTMEEVRAWTAKLRPLGFPVKLRLSGGRERFAGCGQLGTELLRAGASA